MTARPRDTRPPTAAPLKPIRLTEAAALELLLTTTPTVSVITKGEWAGYFR